MHRKIDKLQQEVDQLLEVCAEAGCDEMLDDCRPTPEEKKYERLGVMVLKLQDGVLEPRYLRRMEKWLMADPEALHYYLDFQHLTELLYAHYNKSRFTKMLDFLKGCLHPA